MIAFGPHSADKNRLFDCLEAEGVAYTILRNWQNIIDGDENDIDIWIDRSDLEKFQARYLTEDLQGRYLTNHSSDKLQIILFGTSSTLNIDIQTEITYYGLTYINIPNLADRRVRHPNGFWILDDTASSLIAMLNRLMQNREIREHDWLTLANMDAREREELLSSLLLHGFEKIVEEGLSFGMAAKSSFRRKLISALRRRSWKNFSRELSYRAAKKLRRKNIVFGGMLVLIGTHGAGKSTTAGHVSNCIKQAGLSFRIQHTTSRPGILPSLTRNGRITKADAAATAASNRTNTADVHLQTSPTSHSRKLKHSLRMLYHVVDYWLLSLSIYYKRRSGEVIMLDRYIYDYAVEPRNTFATPPWFRKFCLNIAPTPNLTAILWNDPATIHARKPELPLDALSREVDGYLRLQTKRNARPYKTNIPSEAIAWSIFVEFLTRNGTLPKQNSDASTPFDGSA